MSEERHETRHGGPEARESPLQPADRAIAELLRTRAGRPPAPPGLRARVEAALAAEVEAIGRPAPPIRPGRARWIAPLAAGLGALLLAGATAGLWIGHPAAQRRLAADVVEAALEEYRRLEAAGPTGNPAALSATLSAALGVPVRFAGPAAPGIRLVGTAPTSLLGSAGVGVLMEVDGQVVVLSLVRSPQPLPREGRVDLGGPRPIVKGRGSERVVLWRQGPLLCALAGEFSERRLTALFRAIRPGLVVGG